MHPLHLYQPLPASHGIFLPRQSFIKTGKELQIEKYLKCHKGKLSLERELTLPPFADGPYSAAWDPHSKMPPLSEAQCSLLQSSRPPEYEHKGHWTSDFHLTGFPLCAMVGGKRKTIVLQTTWGNCNVEVYMCKGKTKLEQVLPEIVEAIHLSTVHNYECWVVIKGPHAGKQVCSIHYEKGVTSKMPIWWTVAVVQLVPQAHDKLMGEELHLVLSDICLEDESKKSQEENMQFSCGLCKDGGH